MEYHLVSVHTCAIRFHSSVRLRQNDSDVLDTYSIYHYEANCITLYRWCRYSTGSRCEACDFEAQECRRNQHRTGVRHLHVTGRRLPQCRCVPAGPVRAPQHRRYRGCGGSGGPGCGARGRWRGLAGLRDDAPSEARGADGSRAGRRPRAHTAARPLKAGLTEPGTPAATKQG